MSVNVLVNGASGKMGQETISAVEANPQLTLVAKCYRKDDLGALIKSSNAQVVVDFTSATSVFENAQIIIAAKAHPVIGTSGLVSEEIEILQQQCAAQQLGGIIAPNFSVGAILMMQYAKDAINHMHHAEIIELHHDKKIDSPSGTALKTAQLMTASGTHKPSTLEEKAVIAGARGANYHGIPIHAVRLPGLVAHQEVLFGGYFETLSIKHDSLHRKCFMPGVCLACEKVTHLDHLVYGLESILLSPPPL